MHYPESPYNSLCQQLLGFVRSVLDFSFLPSILVIFSSRAFLKVYFSSQCSGYSFASILVIFFLFFIFQLLIIGGSFGLREFAQIRYDAQKLHSKVSWIILPCTWRTQASRELDKLCTLGSANQHRLAHIHVWELKHEHILNPGAMVTESCTPRLGHKVYFIIAANTPTYSKQRHSLESWALSPILFYFFVEQRIWNLLQILSNIAF